MSTNTPAKITRQLPAITDLYGDVELASKYNDLNKLLNSAPKPEWVKLNPFADNAPYLPIQRVEYLLTTIFIKWRVEIKEIKLLANSVVIAIRLHVLDPITGDWDWQDGVGAAPLQTAKGAGAIEFDKIKGAAVQMGAPAAESYAVKDAAEKFGKLFGKDLSRKDEISYQAMQDSKFDKSESAESIPLSDKLRTAIGSAGTVEALSALYEDPQNRQFHFNEEFMQLLSKRKKEIRPNSAK